MAVVCARQDPPQFPLRPYIEKDRNDWLQYWKEEAERVRKERGG